MTNISGITFGKISNVRKSGDDQNVYFADVEISPAEGFPAEVCLYCARGDDYALTGKWVYQQIVDGNFEGEMTQLTPGVDPVTGLPYPAPTPQEQPATTGTTEL